MDENVQLRNKYSFLGFGEGPRICAGSRLALMQIRTGLASILLNYDITFSSKMVLPLEIDPKSFLRCAKEGLWLKFSKRQK